MDIGERSRAGPHVVARAEIVDFASLWDPQPFHVDPERASRSLFGTLVASGLHTLARTMRMSFDIGPARGRRLAGVGIDALRWVRPVRADERIWCETELLALDPVPGTDHHEAVVEVRCVDDDDRLLMTCETTMRVDCPEGTTPAPALTVDAASDIEAPAERAWMLQSDFVRIDRWLSGATVEGLEHERRARIGSDRRFSIGAVHLHERLVRLDPDTRTLAYRLVEGPLPVRGYRLTSWTHPTGAGRCTVHWQARFRAHAISDDKCLRLVDRALHGALSDLRRAAEAPAGAT